MTDPLGFISGPSTVRPLAGSASEHAPLPSGAPAFKDVLLKNIDEVNRLQQEANQATEDLMSGQRDDPEHVMTAIAKADLAFKTLQAVRNQVIRAYDEIQQMRI